MLPFLSLSPSSMGTCFGVGASSYSRSSGVWRHAYCSVVLWGKTQGQGDGFSWAQCLLPHPRPCWPIFFWASQAACGREFPKRPASLWADRQSLTSRLFQPGDLSSLRHICVDVLSERDSMKDLADRKFVLTDDCDLWGFGISCHACEHLE